MPSNESPMTLAVPPGACAIRDSHEKERHYLLLGLSEEMNSTLEDLAHRTDDTKADILNKAVGLYKLASDATREGKRVVIVDDNQEQENEIVGF